MKTYTFELTNDKIKLLADKFDVSEEMVVEMFDELFVDMAHNNMLLAVCEGLNLFNF